MRTINKYIGSLALFFLSSTVILAFIGEERLDLYFAVYLLECLVVTLLFAHLNPQARRGLNLISFGLFMGFGVIILNRVLEIILGFSIL